MSLAQILGHLRMGDLIIVPGADSFLRVRLGITPGRQDAVDVKQVKSRKLLRNLITVRKGGGKK